MTIKHRVQRAFWMERTEHRRNQAQTLKNQNCLFFLQRGSVLRTERTAVNLDSFMFHPKSKAVLFILSFQFHFIL